MNWKTDTAGVFGAFLREYRKKRDLPPGFNERNVLDFAGWIKDVVCVNQGLHAQYAFLAADKHRDLKGAWNGGVRDTQEISKHTQTLMYYLYDSIADAYSQNIGLINKYFEFEKPYRGSDTLPRITIKVNSTVHDDDDPTVASLQRDRDVKYDSDCQVSENTGFEYIHQNGIEYLCNNIPFYAKRNEYINPRLDPERVKSYLLPEERGDRNFIQRMKEAFSSGQQEEVDESWQRCWVDPMTSRSGYISDPRTCYKSTLIVPMTLWGNTLSPEYISLFDIKDIDVDRVILGYLCFDHPSTDYFRKELDRHVGYIFADVMSLYLLTFLTYTNVSKTLREVMDFLDQSNPDGRLPPAQPQ